MGRAGAWPAPREWIGRATAGEPGLEADQEMAEAAVEEGAEVGENPGETLEAVVAPGEEALVCRICS